MTTLVWHRPCEPLEVEGMLNVVLILSVCMFASTSWAVQRWFARPGGKLEPAMVWLRRLVVASFLLQWVDLLRAPAPARACLNVAAGLYAAGLVLFWSATAVHRRRAPSLAFSPDDPQHLVRSGPYALIRHPFYTAYMCGWIAGFVASGRWTSAIPALFLFAFYERSARLEEQKFAQSPLGAAYRSYVASTGKYLPNPWKIWRAQRGG